MSSAEDVFLYAVPILSSISVAEIMALVRRAVKEKKACVLMMHSIVEKVEFEIHGILRKINLRVWFMR